MYVACFADTHREKEANEIDHDGYWRRNPRHLEPHRSQRYVRQHTRASTGQHDPYAADGGTHGSWLAGVAGLLHCSFFVVCVGVVKLVAFGLVRLHCWLIGWNWRYGL